MGPESGTVVNFFKLRNPSCEVTRVKYSGYTSNGHLFLSTFCAGGGGVV